MNESFSPNMIMFTRLTVFYLQCWHTWALHYCHNRSHCGGKTHSLSQCWALLAKNFSKVVQTNKCNLPKTIDAAPLADSHACTSEIVDA
eukprot:5629581-Amphidinium_carterae.1